MLPHAVTNPGLDSPAARRPNRWEGTVNHLPGIALVGAMAVMAIELGKIPWLQANGISALTLAIALGMIVGNTLYSRIASASSSGVTFSKQTLLRAGIICGPNRQFAAGFQLKTGDFHPFEKDYVLLNLQPEVVGHPNRR